MIRLDAMPFGNGAGSIKTLEQVKRACRGAMNVITVGSITKEPRVGNIGETYYFHPQEFWSINSLGLPNMGLEAYGPLWREIIERSHDAGKKVWASISPFSSEECGEMADRLLCAGLDGVEVNGSCPNVWDGGKQKAIPALDPEAADNMFTVLKKHVGDFSSISFKLSPTRDTELLGALARVFKTHQVYTLVCCNTLPDQEGTRVDGKPALAFRSDESDQVVKHKGGGAGTKSLEDSLFVAEAMHELLPLADIKGSGGVFHFGDAKRYLDVGCMAFQSTTGYLEFGEQLFVDIAMGLSDQAA